MHLAGRTFVEVRNYVRARPGGITEAEKAFQASIDHPVFADERERPVFCGEVDVERLLERVEKLNAVQPYLEGHPHVCRRFRVLGKEPITHRNPLQHAEIGPYQNDEERD